MNDLRKRGGANLRAIREQRGLSCRQLADTMAERFGVIIGADSISKYERGAHPITQEMTAMFAACLGCSVAALMDGLDLSQAVPDNVQELRQLPPEVHEIFRWVATEWDGDIAALATAFGQYAAVPGKYRKYAMMELLVQKDHAIHDGAMADVDTPDCVKLGLPHLEELLGGLYDE